jgi:hypothetical protein
MFGLPDKRSSTVLPFLYSMAVEVRLDDEEIVPKKMCPKLLVGKVILKVLSAMSTHRTVNHYYVYYY